MEDLWKLFENWVTANGGRHTPERRLLFEAVCAMPTLFSTIDVAEHVNRMAEEGRMKLSRPTVYNTLEAFVQSGLLEHIHVKGGNMYVRAGRQGALVLQECSVCGDVQVVKSGGVPEAVAHLSFHHFTPGRSLTVVHGICDKCESARKKEIKQKQKIFK